MTSLFFQYSVICKQWKIAQNNFKFAKVGSKCCQRLNKIYKISPNLVRLVVAYNNIEYEFEIPTDKDLKMFLLQF